MPVRRGRVNDVGQVRSHGAMTEVMTARARLRMPISYRRGEHFGRGKRV